MNKGDRVMLRPLDPKWGYELIKEYNELVNKFGLDINTVYTVTNTYKEGKFVILFMPSVVFINSELLIKHNKKK